MCDKQSPQDHESESMVTPEQSTDTELDSAELAAIYSVLKHHQEELAHLTDIITYV